MNVTYVPTHARTDIIWQNAICSTGTFGSRGYKKVILIFHANCLEWKQFARNVNSCFLRKISKPFSKFCLLIFIQHAKRYKYVPKTVYSIPLSKGSTNNCGGLVIEPIIAHCSPFSFKFNFKSAFIFFSFFWSIGQTVLH